MMDRKFQYFATGFLLVFLVGVLGVSNIVEFNEDELSQEIPNSSMFHIPIHLIGNSEVDIFFAGNGTDGLSLETPYVLEDLEIDAGGVGSALRIENSDRFLVIQNCTLSGASFASGEAGVAFYDVENVFMTECNIQSNTLRGIYFFESSNNEIFQNHIGNNMYGIVFEADSNFNHIANNVINYDNFAGIHIENSNYSTIVQNQISGPSKGISIFDNAMYTNITNNMFEHNNNAIGVNAHSNHTIIHHNTILGGWEGIVINNSYHPIIENNLVSGIGGSGVILNDVTDSSISGNLVENSFMGILVTSSLDNFIFMNKFANCTHAYAKDDGANNWNSSTYGNYWGDFESRYPAATTSNNIIWDTPYQINISSNYDFRPMVEPGNPQVMAPGDLSYSQGGACIPIYWEIYDDTIRSSTTTEYWIYLNDEVVEYGHWYDGEFIFLDTSELSVGVHKFEFKANDGTRFGIVNDTVWVTIMELGTPIITTLTQKISETSILINWDLVPDADYYNVYVNGSLYDSPLAHELLIIFAGEGTHSISVTTMNIAFESPHSNEITITVEFEDPDPDPKIPGYSFVLIVVTVGFVGLIILVKKKVIVIS